MSNVYTSNVTVDSASKGQLEESIRLREQRLAANVDELMGRIHPRAVVARAANSAKDLVVESDGSVKTDRVALAGGIVLGIAALVTVVALRRGRN